MCIRDSIFFKQFHGFNFYFCWEYCFFYCFFSFFFFVFFFTVFSICIIFFKNFIIIFINTFSINIPYQTGWQPQMCIRDRDYICDNCDNAGVWKPNKTGFERSTGLKVSLDSFLKKVNGDKKRIITLENGRWFLPGFIKYQWFTKKDSFDLVLSICLLYTSW